MVKRDSVTAWSGGNCSMSAIRKLLAAVGATITIAAGNAGATTIDPSPTFYFQGTCADCQGTALGELILSNYSFGSSIDASNFVLFHYDGTNLQPAFTITSPSSIAGSISGTGKTLDNVYIADTTHFFQSSASGNWSLGSGPIVLDRGTAGTFNSLAPSLVPSLPLSMIAGVSPTPEPATWLTMILGLTAVGFVLRRQEVATRVSYAV